MKTRFTLTAAAILIAMMFTINGCDNNSSSSDNNETVGGEVGASYGSTIAFVMKGLMSGALGKAGSVPMGLIMDKLGWGDSGDTDTINHMDGELTQIIKELGEIKTEIDTLIVQLNIDTAKIIGNNNDPHIFMTPINHAQETLQEYVDVNATGGSGVKSELTGFAQEITALDAIGTDIDQIIDAIIPIDSGYDGVLTNYTGLLNDKYKLGMVSLADAYNSMELYTSQLIYHEVKGVNLVVEARNLLHKQNLTVLTAVEYLNNYQVKLENQINNLENGSSFFYNTWRLLLSNVDLNRETGNNFLSREAQDIIHRAEFYRTQVTGEEEFGLRVMKVATANFSSSFLQDDMWVEKDGEYYQLSCQPLADNFSGAEYPYWSGNSVNFSSAYKLVTCMPEDDSESLGVGTYRIDYMPTFMPIRLGEVEVEKYDENYTVKPDGNITYGLTTLTDRSSYNQFNESSSMWHFGKDLDNVHVIGSANDWPIEVYNNSFVDNTIFSGSTSLEGRFTYGGASKRTMNVTFSADVHLKAECKGDCAVTTYASYSTGVWNHTAQKYECGRYDETIETNEDDLVEKSWTSHHSCTFIAEPGNVYYVVFKNNINAPKGPDYDYDLLGKRAAWSKLEKVNYINIKFD